MSSLAHHGNGLFAFYIEPALLTLRLSQSIQFAGAKRESILDAVNAVGVDILVTSYHTIVADYKKYLELKDTAKKGSKAKKQKTSTSIFDLIFHRIVLDEAHM
jgi:hypothetical protein